MKQAHRPHRVIHIAGEPLGLAELALGLACGIALAVGGWLAVVFVVAAWGP